MSIEINNSEKKDLKTNEEAFALREIFNNIEAKKENKEIEIENIDNSINEKYNIRNLELSNLNGIEIHPKNRYKSKLQKLLFKKKL
jgi:hypothetical protein